jgi:hypothetical protein
VIDRSEHQRQFVERWEALKPPTSGAWLQKRRLAAAMRIVIGRVIYAAAYEGPPGCVHGGFIASAEGLFITPHPEQYQRMVEARAQREKQSSH